MVKLGMLVKELGIEHRKSRVGTVVKVSPIALSKHGSQMSEQELESLKYRREQSGYKYDPQDSLTIREGNVFSVRWQDNPNSVTIHVAYNDCNGFASINLGSNQVEVVK